MHKVDKLAIVLSPSFVNACAGHAITADDIERASFIKRLQDRKASGMRNMYVENNVEPISLIYNWCIVYDKMWSLTESWERFKEYVKRTKCPKIEKVDGWELGYEATFKTIHSLF